MALSGCPGDKTFDLQQEEVFWSAIWTYLALGWHLSFFSVVLLLIRICIYSLLLCVLLCGFPAITSVHFYASTLRSYRTRLHRFPLYILHFHNFLLLTGPATVVFFTHAACNTVHAVFGGH